MKTLLHLSLFCLCITSSRVALSPRNALLAFLQEHGVPIAYQSIVADALLETNVPPLLFVRLIGIESGWNTKAVNWNKNGTVDRGIAQLNSASLPHFMGYNGGLAVDPHDPAIAIPVATRHLAYLYDIVGTWWGAVMSFNCGLARFKTGNIPISTVRYALAITKED